MDFEQKRKLKRVMYSRTMLVVLLVVLVLVSKGTWNVYGKMESSRENFEKSERELEKLKTRQSALANQIDYLKTDQGIESEIRQKFRVVKEGEEIAVIVDDVQKVSEATTTPQKSLWTKFKSIFTTEQ